MSQQTRKIEVALRGAQLIREPALNKGTAFTQAERRSLELEGLLPVHCKTLDQQVWRVMQSVGARHSELEKFIALADVQDRNETLYYRVLTDHIETCMPIVYTPTVGQATRNFSRVFRRGRGIWITPDLRGRIAKVLRRATRGQEIRLVVATDNESILGIGDQGAGGMAISVGKLALYTVGAGIHPASTLPVSLDVGTNNQALLEDDQYLGWQHPRLSGDEYDELIEEFVSAVMEVFPDALVQWEDFRKNNALAILERYRSRLPSFNDDIQGTGAIALAALLGALRVSGEDLADQRVVIYGAGAAGLGIARQLRAAFREEGVTGVDLARACAVLDSRGLLVGGREIRDAYKKDLAWSPDLAAQYGLDGPHSFDLESVVRAYRPTVLVGTSGQAGAFNEKIVKQMAAHVERPIILPFSNPTDNVEARPHDLYRWTEGRCLVATGSPFAPVEYAGKTYQVGQGNNVFIFPGLGLGALVTRASEITDGMISAAALALASTVSETTLAQGGLVPSVTRLREVSRQVAVAVANKALAEGVCAEFTAAELEAQLDAAMWEPEYAEYVPV